MPVVQFEPKIRIDGLPIAIDPVALGLTELTHHKRIIVATSGTENVDFGGVSTATFILVIADRDFTFNLTAVGASQTVNPNDGIGILLLFNCQETSLSIVNVDSSNTMNLEVVIGG